MSYCFVFVFTAWDWLHIIMHSLSFGFLYALFFCFCNRMRQLHWTEHVTVSVVFILVPVAPLFSWLFSLQWNVSAPLFTLLHLSALLHVKRCSALFLFLSCSFSPWMNCSIPPCKMIHYYLACFRMAPSPERYQLCCLQRKPYYTVPNQRCVGADSKALPLN